MKIYFLRAIALILLNAFIALNSGQMAYAQDFPPDDWQGGAEGGWYVNVDVDDPLNIRSLPSHKSVKVGIVKRGVEVNVLDTAENGWRFIEATSVSGWVNGIYLSNRPLEAKEDVPNIQVRETLPEYILDSAKSKQPVAISEIPSTPQVASNNFEDEFSKLKNIFRSNDRCFQSLKRRSELVGYTMKLEQNDPTAFRNLKSKHDECMEVVNSEKLQIIKKNLLELTVTDAQVTRIENFSREYKEIIENSVGLLQIGQLMGISFE